MSNDIVLDPVEQKKKYRALTAQLMSKAVEDIESGKIAVKSVKDVERLVKLDMLLLGTHTESTVISHNGTVSIKEEL